MIRFDTILEKVSSTYSEKDITLLKKAYVFAARAHKGQIRRSGEPYLSHPLEVANMLADMSLDATTLVAGLLHDVLEDTEVTAPDIQKDFSKEIAHLIEGVTKISLVEASSPEIRKAESIRKIILAMTDDVRVIFIKLADRIHNLKTLKFLPEEKQKRIAKETLDLYAPIANRLGMGRIKAELEDLSFRYVDPENFFKIASLVDPLRKKAEKELLDIKKSLEQLLEKNQIPAEIFYRIKRPYSIFHKLNRQNIDFDQVYDFMALRLITDSVKNCYAALGIVHQKWPHIPHRFRDFIAMPKPNLYQALHTTIITDMKQTVEIQFRTQDMHNLAENGISAHWRYKEADPKAITKEDKRLVWLREVAELYREQKSPKEFLKTLKADLIPEEVYAFTPKGKIITMPLGATVLDFAFKIHSELGLHATGGKVNGKSVSLRTVLKPGDIVEILSLSDRNPSRDWLNYAFTSSARHSIKHWLNRQDRIKNRHLGKKLWEKQLSQYTLPSSVKKEKGLLASISQASHFTVRKLDDFYALIGSGKIVLNKKLMEKIIPEVSLTAKRASLLKKVVKKVAKKPRTVIQVEGKDTSHLKIAKCCSPIKGEPIIGYITSGKGITIHSLRCPLVTKEILDPQRTIEASWDKTSKKEYRGRLLINAKDTPGVLAKLTAAIAQQAGNITKAEVKTFLDKPAQIKLSLNIYDIDHLDRIIDRLSKIKDILSVDRV
ncbi:MAG: bifunctional (p)ppGpp synthetase/guanosine-3',5'-bis(diphosphate) 3'-pyrophosphohydrolase [Candidatus Aminicenantes bacterium]|nr:bifunctional (p)ppGpp synthetase/guanosine-3',5'-bis(diphosphate) 3'-pyrophosphohydrolase [Candidatus Aminicenantes bacterium]